MSVNAETTRLVPEFTKEDFDTEKPYAWLYHLQGSNKFLAAQALNKLIQKASELGVKVTQFRAYWKAYVETVTPQNNVAGRNETNFPDQPAVMQCGEYICDDRGVRKFGHMGEEIEVISHPILPVRTSIDIDTGEHKLAVAYKRGEDEWHQIVVPRETVASSQKIVSLARNGIAVNSENARDVVRFLSDVEAMNYEQMPVARSTSHMGWLHGNYFAPYDGDVLFDGDSEEFTRLQKDFQEHGDYDAWLDFVRKIRAGGSKAARIALAASFAAPLVKPLGALCFFVHLMGFSGTGKTVALMLGASVWGNPTMGRYVKTFSGTKVSQELFAAFCCNMPVFMDELQVIADRQTFDDIIYALCEGVSKGRGVKGGGLQTQKSWATTFVTTGEWPVVKSNSGTGASVRTIEVSVGDQKVFDDARFAAGFLQENYGFAGKRFVAELTRDDTITRARQIQNDYYRQLAGPVQDKQVLSASVLLTADRLADEFIFHDGNALTVDDILPYLVTTEDADQNARCWAWLCGYLAANQNRFKEDSIGEIWGVRQDGTTSVIRSVFDRILEDNGYSPKTFLMWAKKHGKIEADNYGPNTKNNRLTKRKKIGGDTVPCVVLITREIAWESADDEPLPF